MAKNIAHGVGSRDGTIRFRVVNDGREEVCSLNQCLVIVQTPNRGVVGLVDTR